MSWHVIKEIRRGSPGWAIRRSGSSRALGVVGFYRDAVRIAKLHAGREGGQVVVHNHDGTVKRVIDTMKKAKAAEKVAASVHIYDAPGMTKEGRREIAGWLRKHAAWLLKDGGQYAKRFRGRYFYSVD